ncbi:MAG: hypothetical protein R2818_12605 [Flavobacteriales bacterium]
MRRSLTPLFLLLGLTLAAQNDAPARSAEEKLQQRSAVLDPVQGGWAVEAINEFAETGTVLFSTGNNSSDVKIQLDQFRAERNSALAKNQGALTAAEERRLSQLAGAMNALAPSSFEAHLANFYIDFPRPKAFEELALAKAKDTGRPELLAPLLVAAARTDDATELTARARAMKLEGAVAPGLYRFAADLFSSLDPDAILIAAGEMDAYPMWVEQFANGRRKDVLVVDQRLLIDPLYRTRIWGRAKAAGPVPQADGFIAALGRSSPRPVFLSLGLGARMMAPLSNDLYVTGLAMRLSTSPVENIPRLEERWGRFKKAMDAGPLSKNYLVPGAVLLAHYRKIGDEARASRLEAELRTMAARLGATNNMIKSGVFAH